MYKIGPNKFMGGGGVCGRGEKGGAFCSVCIFHNQKMHVYLIFVVFKQTIHFLQQINVKKIQVHPVYGTRIRTHDLSNISRLP